MKNPTSRNVLVGLVIGGVYAFARSVGNLQGLDTPARTYGVCSALAASAGPIANRLFRKS